MPSGREHGFSQGEESTSYGHVCLVTANSGLGLHFKRKEQKKQKQLAIF